MSQKIVSEPKIAMRTLNQTRNVRDRRAAITRKLNHADDRMQRRERIGRDFRTRRRDFSQQRRFSRIRITDESSIGNRAQLEQKMSLLAFLAFGVFARRAIARAFEMNIPLPARAAATKHKLLTVARKINN